MEVVGASTAQERTILLDRLLAPDNMKYAVVPQIEECNLTWIYQIPIGSWMIGRMESDGSVGVYVGLKGIDFNEEQTNQVNGCNGLIFSSDVDFVAWRDEHGEYYHNY